MCLARLGRRRELAQRVGVSSNAMDHIEWHRSARAFITDGGDIEALLDTLRRLATIAGGDQDYALLSEYYPPRSAYKNSSY